MPPIAIALIVGLLALGTGRPAALDDAHPQPLAIGAAAPDFSLPAVDGKTYTLASFKDAKVLVVIFTAVHCPTAEIYEGRIKQLVADYKGRGVQFLATNVGETPDEVKKFLKEKPFPYPVLLDANQETAGKLGVFALPTLLVVDKKGNVSYIQSGIADGDTLRQLIKKAGS